MRQPVRARRNPVRGTALLARRMWLFKQLRVHRWHLASKPDRRLRRKVVRGVRLADQHRFEAMMRLNRTAKLAKGKRRR